MARQWTKEEEILAFALYCKVSFGKIHTHNDLIRSLASILNRTPASVAMKMCNFARFDTSLQSRGIAGLKNGSRLDKEVWDEFSSNLELLEIKSKEVLQSFNLQEDSSDKWSALPVGGESERVVHIRQNQSFFRQTVLLSYENACCITGIAVPALLNASHIKPWRDSDPLTERTNPQNGLCLNALHDRAFDRGLITIDQDYRIVLSKQIKEFYPTDAVREYFFRYEGSRIRLPYRFHPSKEFLAYHNVNIFERNL